MSEGILQGIHLTVSALALVFAALGVLILVMHLLLRAFPARVPAAAAAEAEAGPPGGGSPEADAATGEIVAAIAVAMAQLRRLDAAQAGLGVTLGAGATAWGQAVRIRQLRIRGDRT